MRANEILTAVVHGARRDEPSPQVQLAAMNALFNSLEFVRDNFEREVSRSLFHCVCTSRRDLAGLGCDCSSSQSTPDSYLPRMLHLA